MKLLFMCYSQITCRMRCLAVCLLLAVGVIALAGCDSGQATSTGEAASGCWAMVQGPDLSTPAAGITAMHAVSPGDIWAVGQTGNENGDVSRTLTMHWDGHVWSVVPSPNGPNPDTGRNSLYGVSASSATNVWAVGAYTRGGSQFRTLAMHYDGNQWAIVPTPDLGEHDDELKAVLALGENDVWAVGSYLMNERQDGHMVILHWDGKQWSRSPLPLNVTHTLLSITGSGPDDIWAVGTQVMHWNGKNWRILPTDEGAYFDGVTIAGKNSVWVVGNDGNDAITLHWDGQKLNIVPPPAAAAKAFLHEVVTLPGGDVWAAGEGVDNPRLRQPVLMKWTGEQWTLFPNPAPGTDSRLEALTQAGGELWAAGSQGKDGKDRSFVLRYSPTAVCK